MREWKMAEFLHFPICHFPILAFSTLCRFYHFHVVHFPFLHFHVVHYTGSCVWCGKCTTWKWQNLPFFFYLNQIMMHTNDFVELVTFSEIWHRPHVLFTTVEPVTAGPLVTFPCSQGRDSPHGQSRVYRAFPPVYHNTIAMEGVFETSFEIEHENNARCFSHYEGEQWCSESFSWVTHS